MPANELGDVLRAFFTATVALPACPIETPHGSIWWEQDGAWSYPWRVIEVIDGVACGYPCGEPRRSTVNG